MSSPSPSCLPIQCTALEIRSSHLRVLTLNNSYHGVATFDCPFGYRLTGRQTITCEGGGAWSGLVPECEGSLKYVLCLAVIHVVVQLSSAPPLQPLCMAPWSPPLSTMWGPLCRVCAALAMSWLESLSPGARRAVSGHTPRPSVSTRQEGVPGPYIYTCYRCASMSLPRCSSTRQDHTYQVCLLCG